MRTYLRHPIASTLAYMRATRTTWAYMRCIDNASFRSSVMHLSLAAILVATVPAQLAGAVYFLLTNPFAGATSQAVTLFVFSGVCLFGATLLVRAAFSTASSYKQQALHEKDETSIGLARIEEWLANK